MFSAPVTVVSSGVVPAAQTRSGDGVAEVSQAMALARGALGEVIVARPTLVTLPASHLSAAGTLASGRIAALRGGASGLTLTRWTGQESNTH